jgi:hypothetical protein
MAVYAEYIALLNFIHDSFLAGRLPGHICNAKTFIRPIAVMELKTCGMTLTAFFTAQFAFITPEPLP